MDHVPVTIIPENIFFCKGDKDKIVSLRNSWYYLDMEKVATKNKAKRVRKTVFPVLIEQDENGMYVGSVPSLRSCYTQGKTLEELYSNLEEVVELSLEAEKEFFGTPLPLNRIVGFQNIEFRVA